MEPLVDRLGLEKLEVLLKKGRQVDWFVCATNIKKTFTVSRGDLIVFSGDGRAWTRRNAQWKTGQTWNVATMGNSLYVDGWIMDRQKARDITH